MYIPCAIHQNTLLSWHNLQTVRGIITLWLVCKCTYLVRFLQALSFPGTTSKSSELSLSNLSESAHTVCDSPKHTAVLAQPPKSPRNYPSLTGPLVYLLSAIPPSTLLSLHNLQKTGIIHHYMLFYNQRDSRSARNSSSESKVTRAMKLNCADAVLQGRIAIAWATKN